MISLPALIDCHVHFREPGLTHKATMASEAVAALAGGVHTVCDMPNTIPPTTSREALSDKIERSNKLQAPSSKLDLRFFFGITDASHINELRAVCGDPALRSRLAGVKLYLDHSTGEQKIEAALLDDAFAVCSEQGLVAVCHCEDPAANAAAAASVREELASVTDPAARIAYHSRMRPPESEVIAIERAIDLARRHGTHLHVAHLSTAGGLDRVRTAKTDGVMVTCEAAPHHLFLTTDDYATLGALGKMNPPLRSVDHRDALWGGVLDGTVDCIATDHAPHTVEEKRTDDPLAAPSGVPGVETMLPLLLSVTLGHWPHPTSDKPSSLTAGRLPHTTIETLCFTNPNRIFSLGNDPDAERLTIDPDAEWTIEGKNLHSRCGWTPYEGWMVSGRIS